MGIIRKANTQDAQAIISIAYATWPVAYRFINNEEQINYMLDLFYKEDVVNAQLTDTTHLFYIYEHDNGEVVGYAQAYPAKDGISYHLSKLYVLPSEQGFGIGIKLLTVLENDLKESAAAGLSLNVNRRNPAVAFYKKLGYVIQQSVDIPLDKYILDDYIMYKSF
jgi:diamine N-acetyltransferase